MKTNDRRFRGLALVAALGAASMMFTVAAPVQARRGGGRIRKIFPLVPTQAGAQAGLKGRGRIEARPDRGRERVDVEVESRRLDPGVVVDAYVIHSSNPGTPVLLGSITLQRRPGRPGEVGGEIELKTHEGNPPPGGAIP
ncbi:MAG TPA: hypothetical protein VK689_09740, partial [Armatimonadota bacterium]|nr:hypothetical protein [Armatimonadota bacterium]